MKNFNITKPSVSGFSFLVAAALFLLSSCVKDRDANPTLVARLNVVNSSPQSSSLEFSLNQGRRSLINFDYRYYTGYFNAAPGVTSFAVYKKNGTAALLTKEITLLNQKHYTLFIVDTLSKMDAVLVRDSSRTAGADSIRIRFANMIPDVPAVDFYVQGKNEPLATNVAYKTAAPFFSMKAANDVVFEVKATGQSTVLATSEKRNLLNKEFYTIWSSGFKSKTDDAKIIMGAIKH